jgi:hypothetical protein
MNYDRHASQRYQHAGASCTCRNVPKKDCGKVARHEARGNNNEVQAIFVAACSSSTITYGAPEMNAKNRRQNAGYSAIAMNRLDPNSWAKPRSMPAAETDLGAVRFFEHRQYAMTTTPAIQTTPKNHAPARDVDDESGQWRAPPLAQPPSRW